MNQLKQVLDFLSEMIKLLNLQTKMGVGDKKQTADAASAYDWLLEEMKSGKSTRVQISKEPDLKPGKIYIFKYDAKYKKELDYWDKHPIVLVFGMHDGPSGKTAVGVNLSWYPPEARKFMVERIRKMYKPLYETEIKRKPQQAIDKNLFQSIYMQLKPHWMNLGFHLHYDNIYLQICEHQKFVFVMKIGIKQLN